MDQRTIILFLGALAMLVLIIIGGLRFNQGNPIDVGAITAPDELPDRVQHRISPDGTIVVSNSIVVDPVSHASAIITWGGIVVLADPVGDIASYRSVDSPDVVFVTHRHGDHLDPELLLSLLTEQTTFIAPQDVIEQVPGVEIANVVPLAPGESYTVESLTFEAIPAYNLREEAKDFHPQWREDIGLVITDGETRMYFSGDTEGIPEVRALEDIDVAFMAINLPYTMGVEDAADVVLDFAPRSVYPYHYRTPDGFTDLERFKEIVETEDPSIVVNLVDWYPGEDHGHDHEDEQ